PAKPRRLYTEHTGQAVEGALRWLAAQQNRGRGDANGSWSAKVGFKINDGYRLQPQTQPQEGLPHLGVTALAGMAFLSGGHLPGQGPYGDVMDRALDFVLRSVQEDGQVTAYKTRMYSHAFSLLFLAEVYGMTGRPDLREHIDRAVEFTYKSQNEKGGWRYAPLARDSDMSITVCQVVALREARNIGIRVPRKTIDKALKYVMESAITPPHSDSGAFLYQHKDVPFNRNSFALTAAGLTTIYQAGLYSDRAVARFCRDHNIRRVPSIRHCLSYLRRHYETVWMDYSDHYFYYYGNYYAAQAMYTHGGRAWERWYSTVRDDLLQIANQRRATGGREIYWHSRHVGDVFPTAVAAIILQVPKHYLPIFQR
ncbi:MAG: hypothetical protein ACYS6Z_13880, partial [Planctomycetota bacterium]